MKFDFATATRIVFGAGSMRGVGALVREFGTRAMVVSGRTVDRAEPLCRILGDYGVSSVMFAVAGEPEISAIERGVTLARAEGCQMIIGYGGGSALDAAKAIAAMLANDGEVLDYVEIIGRGRVLSKPSVPFIAIPTTAGTGAEVTRNAVLGAPDHQLKVSLRSPLMLARVAIVDPELTYDLPPAITASTGLDALTQLIEPYVCSRANALTDGLCVEGMRRVARSLCVAFADGRNTAAREDMAAASLMGGLALANAGLGAVHGIAGPLGGGFPAPHGAACAALLPHVMASNVRAMRERDPQNPALARYREIARLLTGMPDADANAGTGWVLRLIEVLRIPPLRSYGIGPEDLTDLATNAANTSSMKANPIQLTPSELVEVMRQAL